MYRSTYLQRIHDNSPSRVRSPKTPLNPSFANRDRATVFMSKLCINKSSPSVAKSVLPQKKTKPTISSEGSTEPNHDSWKISELAWDSSVELPAPEPPAEEVSMVKSQYGSVSFGLTLCRLYSKVFEMTAWLVKNPRPSWNCSGVQKQKRVTTYEKVFMSHNRSSPSLFD